MLSHGIKTDSDRAGFHRDSRPVLLGLVLIAAGLLALAGCGGDEGKSEKDDLVLATVADVDITGSYYEFKLAKLEREELPRGEDGRTLDMSWLEGKSKFLETLINKELMARKATDLGYANDPDVARVRESMTSQHAVYQMWSETIDEPTREITEEELQAFYDRMGEVRDCNYILTNRKDDAEAARELARSGADWSEVAERYHDGAVPPTGEYEITIPYGRYNMEFDTDVFETEVGDVAPPILSEYGYWVLRVNEVRDTGRPDLEEAKAQILDIFRNRRMGEMRREFREETRKKWGFFINEDALWVVYNGLPRGEVLLDPETKQPTARENLEDLDIDPKDLDMVLFGYDLGEGEVEQTIGDYKVHFDRMSVFQRPKRSEMLGGLRQKIARELDKVVLNKEAEERGYFEHPDVVDEVRGTVEEIMVTKLYEDVVSIEDFISVAEVQQFYDEHIEDYFIPELRSGRMVICVSEERAEEARDFIAGGAAWKEVLVRFGTDRNNKDRAGKLDQLSGRSEGPVPETLFRMEKGEISEPIPMGSGRFAVIRLDRITPAHQQTLDEVREQIGQRIRNRRQEEAFQNLLKKWAEEYGVVRYPERLAEVASWEELTYTEAPGEIVPREN